MVIRSAPAARNRPIVSEAKSDDQIWAVRRPRRRRASNRSWSGLEAAPGRHSPGEGDSSRAWFAPPTTTRRPNGQGCERTHLLEMIWKLIGDMQLTFQSSWPCSLQI